MQSLEQIVRGCKKQDALSQKLLYQQYFSLMMTICMRYGKSKEDAEEMMNNGFLKIFVNIHQFEGKGSFEGWMKRIMANSCLDFLKSRLHRTGVKMVALTDEVNDLDAHFDNILFNQGYFSKNGQEEKFDRQEMIHLLQCLPEVTRMVFNLHVFEEYSHKEISQLLDMAERTSQWHLSNARKTLAEALSDKKKPKKKIAGL
jgi:RNA polymerase sigma factor (sigma-70 family)